MQGSWVASNIHQKSLVQSWNMQGNHGENLIASQKGISEEFEVGQGYKNNLFDRLLECVQVKRISVLDEANHLAILVIFVLSNCTNVYQLDDDVLHKPFKHGFKQAFDLYTSNILMK